MGGGGVVVGLVGGFVGGLLFGGNLTPVGVAAVAAVAVAATGQVLQHSDRRYARSKDEEARLEQKAAARREAERRWPDGGRPRALRRGDVRRGQWRLAARQSHRCRDGPDGINDGLGFTATHDLRSTVNSAWAGWQWRHR